MKTAVLVLAAGRSRRFGPENKLLAPLNGMPLVSHVARVACAVPADLRLAVVSDDAVAACFAGFKVLCQSDPEAQQAQNLRLGVASAAEADVDRLLVCLGDMPNVTAEILVTALERCTATTASASSDGTRRLPPACFPKRMFGDLRALDGDRGAGTLLKGLGPASVAIWPTELLADVDTPQDLVRLDAGAGTAGNG